MVSSDQIEGSFLFGIQVVPGGPAAGQGEARQILFWAIWGFVGGPWIPLGPLAPMAYTSDCTFLQSSKKSELLKPL